MDLHQYFGALHLLLNKDLSATKISVLRTF